METMETIELLGTNNPNYKVKFISIVRPYVSYSTKELIDMCDSLCVNKEVIVECVNSSTKELNEMVMELMHIGIAFGDASFHEEQ